MNHNVRSTLGIQYSSLLRANQSRHQLSIRIKWYFADPLALPQRICINLELLSKPNQCCFSWIAQLFSVATDCIAAQNGGSQQLVFRRIRRANVFRSNDVPLCNHFSNSHSILCQRTGFIGTNDRNRTQTFYRLQLSHNRMFPCHFLRTEREHNGNNGTQCLRNGSYCKCNGKQQAIHQFIPADSAVPCTPDTQSEYQRTDNQNSNGQSLSKLIQCTLQRCFPFLCILNHRCNFSDFRMRANIRNQHRSTSIRYKASAISHCMAISKRNLLCNRLYGFLYI